MEIRYNLFRLLAVKKRLIYFSLYEIQGLLSFNGKKFNFNSQ